MISFLVAMDRNQVIGYQNELPWRLPADLAYFKEKTTGHKVIMGRKTFESIGRPLPNRVNIVLTKDRRFFAEGCVVRHSLEDVMALISEEEEAFVIGGAQMFELFLPYVDRMYITCIDHEFCGDTFFPTIDFRQWELVSEKKGIKNEKNPYDYTFLVYEKLPH